MDGPFVLPDGTLQQAHSTSNTDVSLYSKGTGSEVRRFYLPGENPGRTAQINCVSAHISEFGPAAACGASTPTIHVRLVYGLLGAEPDNFCATTDCESVLPTHKGACIRTRKGAEDLAEMKNADMCVQIGDKDQAFNPMKNVSRDTLAFSMDPKLDTTPVINGTIGMGDLIPSYDFYLENGVRSGPAYYFKAHGNALAHFFLEYRVVAPVGCTWVPEVSFSGMASRPESGYCFKPEDTKLGYKDMKTDTRVNGKWLDRENKTSTDYNFDFDAAAMAAMPRSANLKYEMENVLVSTGKTYAWLVGDGPTTDLDCVHIHSTAAVWDQLVNSKTYDHNGYLNFQCYDSLFGHHGVPNLPPHAAMASDPGNEFDEHRLTGMRQETYGLSLIETLQCGGGVMESEAEILNYLKQSRFNAEGYEVNLWSTCCGKIVKDSCEGVVGAGGMHQCVWVDNTNKIGSCLPMVTSTAVNLKRQVGINKKFSYLSSVASMPLSAYVMQEDVNDERLYGLGRRWVLQYKNNYGSTTTVPPEPCTQSVTIGFKSNVHGGVCEPAGREFCNAQMDQCVYMGPDSTKAYTWALKEGQVDTASMSAVDADRYSICSCLKQKENCYRNVGCTSTKAYQLILQNCYHVGCGNTCIRDY